MRTGLLGKLAPDWASAGDARARKAARQAAAAAASRHHPGQRANGFLGCGRMWLSLINFVLARTVDRPDGPERIRSIRAKLDRERNVQLGLSHVRSSL